MIHYTEATVEHFQRPRNVGRLPRPDAVGRVDDPETETTIEVYLRIAAGVVAQASFRTLGCSACIAASSIATELIVGLAADALARMDGDTLDRALGGLPEAKRYCADLVAEAVRRAGRPGPAPPAGAG